MIARIDPTSIISPDAIFGEDVTVGPFSIIGSNVIVGEGTTIGPYTRVEGPVRIGARNRFFGQSSIGTEPQDLKFRGEKTELVIGDDNVFREFVTVNRGTQGGGGITTFGSGNFMMAYSHVAHDCHVGSGVIFANGATLAGHVEVGDFATVGAFSAVHQFCRVGEHAFIGGFTVVTQDALPFVKTVGSRPAKTYGVNTIGLERRGFSKESIEAVQRTYRILLRSKLKLDEALTRIESDLGQFAEARYFADFVRSAKRGIIR
jgi:UDP-N-acetylglucosamine acyltransferase